MTLSNGAKHIKVNVCAIVSYADDWRFLSIFNNNVTSCSHKHMSECVFPELEKDLCESST